MKTYYIIYKITNLVNGKIYIGQTVRTLEKRWDNHIWHARSSKTNFPLHRAIRKYGEENFKIEFVEQCASKKQLNLREIEIIKDMNSKIPNGYNQTDGGEGKLGVKWTVDQFNKRKKYQASEETNAKISAALKGRPRPDEVKAKISAALTGKKLSDEHKEKLRKRVYSDDTRKKMSESQKGHKASDETKKKMSNAHKGNKYCLGIKQSEETKQKKRIAMMGNKCALGYKHNEEARKKMVNAQIGHKTSEETKEKIRMANKGRKPTDETRKKMSMAGFLNWQRKRHQKNKEVIN